MRLLLLMVATLAPFSISADELTVQQVLSRSQKTHPKLAGARASIQEQEGLALSAKSVFEPKLKGMADTRPLGYYNNTRALGAIEQTIPGTSVRLEGGYRYGRGDFPLYYGERQTLDLGEAYGGVRLPLLRDLLIDEDRATIRKRQMDISISKLEATRVWVDLARDGASAYYEWVAAGRLLKVQQELLSIAEIRFQQIEAQTQAGQRPRIQTTDARRIVLARQASVQKAEADFVKAQNKLSLYYRTQAGKPVVASLTMIPKSLPVPILHVKQTDANRRPELRQLQIAQAQANIDYRLGKNDRLPSLDLTGFISRDLGQGDPTLVGTEVAVGVVLSVPIFQRKGRGKQDAARAKKLKIKRTEQYFGEQVRAQAESTHRALELALARVNIANERLQATETLAEAERTRFRQGNSDLLRINVRETDVADAAKEKIEAELAAHQANVDYLNTQGKTLLQPN